MEVTCPKCTSKFNLPNALVRPGAKMRCSVCKEIFHLEVPSFSGDTSSLDLDAPSDKDNESTTKMSKKILIFVLVLLLLGAGAAGTWWYTQQGKEKNTVALKTERMPQDVALLSMNNVRQYYVKNEKIGPVFVVEGFVVNGFDKAKELIAVEATIYDGEHTPLASKKQLAGTVLSLFQLQVLGEEELEAFLKNNIEILSNNTNVAPNAEVPFMVLFYNPPLSVAQFNIEIVEARDVQSP